MADIKDTKDVKSNCPIKTTRLREIAEEACNKAIGSAEFYEHDKTETWNTAIINDILKTLITETATASGSSAPTYKFAVNSTIVQHLVPTSQLNKAKGSDEADKKSTATSTDGKPHVGRRGMHSAQAAYWNEKTDGMWTYKYEGGSNKGMDIVIMVLWVAFA